MISCYENEEKLQRPLGSLDPEAKFILVKWGGVGHFEVAFCLFVSRAFFGLWVKRPSRERDKGEGA